MYILRVRSELLLLPTRTEEKLELQLANELISGLWSNHSKNVAKAAEKIAKF